MDKKERNAHLKKHGYTWVKYDPPEEYEYEEPTWNLFTPQGEIITLTNALAIIAGTLTRAEWLAQREARYKQERDEYYHDYLISVARTYDQIAAWVNDLTDARRALAQIDPAIIATLAPFDDGDRIDLRQLYALIAPDKDMVWVTLFGDSADALEGDALQKSKAAEWTNTVRSLERYIKAMSWPELPASLAQHGYAPIPRGQRPPVDIPPRQPAPGPYPDGIDDLIEEELARLGL